jgi:hypothetical protein
VATKSWAVTRFKRDNVKRLWSVTTFEQKHVDDPWQAFIVSLNGPFELLLSSIPKFFILYSLYVLLPNAKKGSKPKTHRTLLASNCL